MFQPILLHLRQVNGSFMLFNVHTHNLVFPAPIVMLKSQWWCNESFLTVRVGLLSCVCYFRVCGGSGVRFFLSNSCGFHQPLVNRYSFQYALTVLRRYLPWVVSSPFIQTHTPLLFSSPPVLKDVSLESSETMSYTGTNIILGVQRHLGYVDIYYCVSTLGFGKRFNKTKDRRLVE